MDVALALHGRISFVVGSQKNAGKTTFLNWAAQQLRRLGPVTLASVGVDGEARDLVFGNPKPRVPVEPGDFVLTTEGALRNTTALTRIVEVFPGSTVLGRLVLAEVLRGDVVELVGPETNSQLGEMLAEARGLGPATILVDGAVNRVTQVSSAVRAAVVDVVRLVPAQTRAVEERLRFLSRVMEIETCPFEKAPPEGWVELPGALTAARVASLPRDFRGVVVTDFSCLFVDAATLASLQGRVFFRRTFDHVAVVLNAFDIDETAFLAASRMSEALRERILLNPFKEGEA